MSFKSSFIFIAAAATGCGSVFVQPVAQVKGHVQTGTKNSEITDASGKKPKQTLSQKLNHENDRMSGKVLWRNNKNHAAGSDCLCSFAQNKHKCDRNHDDDSHCFLVCCIAGKTSDCKCGWAIGAGACDATKNDGSDCFASCCNDVAKDLQTYGPMAYPGAELLYPPGTAVPRNPFWKDDLPQTSQVQQLYPTGPQPTNMSQSGPAAQGYPQPTANMSQGYPQPAANMSQGYPAAQGYPQPAANMSQGYPAAQGYPQPAANVSQGGASQYSGPPSAHPYQTQYHGPPAASSYGLVNTTNNTRLVQRSRRGHKHRHNKGNHK